MDKQFLLKQFRLGFRKVKDKSTGTVYLASGKLDKKVSRLNNYSILSIALCLIFLLSDVIKSLPIVIGLLLVYFIAMSFVLKEVAKRMILEEDLVDVVEKVKT
jgi:hypothetical protein